MIGLTGSSMASRMAAGLPIPTPILVRGVIDSGSDITCVAERVMRQLNLAPSGQNTTQTTTGSFRVNLYEVSLTIPPVGRVPGPFAVHDYLMVMELAPTSTGIEVLVGMDILGELLFLLDGPRNEFTLGD